MPPPETRSRVMLSWSTGKDSAWALHRLRADPALDVVGLVSTVNGAGERERVSIHGVRMALLGMQAAAVGLPLRLVPLPDPCTNADYERAMAAFVEGAVADGVRHIAFGDLFLDDVRRYREERLAGSGLAPLFPIWGEDTPTLAKTMIAAGARARIVSVDLEQLGRAFLGREFDAAFLDDLPAGVDPCGERGEFHTFCYAGPEFAAPVPVVMGAVRGDARFVHQEPRLAR